MALPPIGRGVKIAIATLFSIWLVFAIAINWGNASEQVFLLFCGNTQSLLHGQVWRLFTAPLLHMPSGNVSHILFTVLGLYFLAPTLESNWGSARTLRFLFLSGVLAYATQALLELVLPASFAAKLIPDYWFGATPVLEAVAIAYALTFRGNTVRLMFLFPVTSTGLIWFVVGINVLYMIAAARPPEGLIAPFGGMFAGWLLGGSTPSPLRRAYLKLRLKQLDRQATQEGRARAARAKSAPFKVIEGGQSKGRANGNGGNGSGDGWLH
jgi:membrane associated rhomboid family serine protease